MVTVLTCLTEGCLDAWWTAGGAHSGHLVARRVVSTLTTFQPAVLAIVTVFAICAGRQEQEQQVDSRSKRKTATFSRLKILERTLP